MLTNRKPKSKEVTEAQALKRIAAQCAKSEHCSGEVDDKLRRWGLSAQERARIIAKLIDAKFIDDERFTNYFVHDKIKLSHWGQRKIEVALRQKHVDSSIISNVLDAVDDNEYLEILRPMIRQKMESVTAKSDYERAMKTIKWAMGRGFTMDVIRKCIDDADEYAED